LTNTTYRGFEVGGEEEEDGEAVGVDMDMERSTNQVRRRREGRKQR
jgi:hypothetical protein